MARRHGSIRGGMSELGEYSDKYWGSFHEVAPVRLNLSLVHRNDVRVIDDGLAGKPAVPRNGARRPELQYDYDVIVVGGGAGGATFAYACAVAGKSVLLLERGSRYTTTSSSHDERAMLIDKRPYDDREVDVNGTAKRLYMGGMLGGGTSLYGGALVRPSDQDFQPGKYYGKRIPRAIWDWPISYADLEPHYTEAERLYAVAGRGEEDFAPLQKPAAGYPGDPLPLHPLNQTAHRRESRAWVTPVSAAAGDRLVSLPALRRLRGIHLSHRRSQLVGSIARTSHRSWPSHQDSNSGRSRAIGHGTGYRCHVDRSA